MSQTSKTFVITGTLKGMMDKTELVLKNEEISPEPLATVKSNGQQFKMTGIIKEPGMYYIQPKNSQQKLMIFLDASNINVVGDFVKLQTASVSGSSTQEDFNFFNNTFNPIFGKLSALAQQLNQGVKDTDGSIRKQYQDLVALVNQNTDSFISAHPASPVSSFVLLVAMQLNQDFSVHESRLNKIDAKAKENYFGRLAIKAIEDGKFGSIGSEAATFTQADVNGKEVALSSVKGKYVLIMNSDTEFIDNAVKIALDEYKKIEEHQKIGMLGCQLLGYDHVIQFNSNLYFPSIKEFLRANPFAIKFNKFQN